MSRSLERIKRISRILVVSIFTRVGRVASVYMVTKNSSNSFQARRSMEIRGLASIVWVGGVARIFRLENEGNVTSVAKEIIVLIESKLECVVRTGILSGVAWVGSLERIKRISRMLVVSIFTRVGRVASVYMVTKNSSNSIQARRSMEIRGLASIVWVGGVARIFRLENEGNVTSVAKEIIVLIESKLECVVRTGILSGVAWVGSLERIKRISRILVVSIFTRVGRVASVYMVTKNSSNSIQARRSMEIRGLASIVWVGGVARIFRLENEGNVTSVAKEIIVLIESKLECVVRTGILSGVAWVGSLERIKRISRMLVVSIFTRVGRVASVYMVTKNSSNSIQARRSMEIRGLASIVWVGGVARIFRLENEGNVTSVAKEIIVLIESKLECVVRTGILSGVAWVGSLERIKRISRMLVVSIFTRVGRVASVYMVTKNSSNSIQARRSMEIRGLASIVWVGGVARIFRLENEGNVTSVAKEIIVLIESTLECVVRTGILSGVAWVGSLERIKGISRMLVVSIFTRVGRVASVYMVTKNSSNSIQARRSMEIRGLASIVWVGGVARIFRLENEGNVTSVAKEIIVLIESKLECVVRTGILSGVAWVGSLERIKRISRMLVVSIFTRVGRVASVYMVTKNSSNSIQARWSMEIRGLGSIVWVGGKNRGL